MNRETKQLRKLIDDYLYQGYDQTQIIDGLRRAGWPEDLIREAFVTLQPKPEKQPASNTIGVNDEAKIDIYDGKRKHKKPRKSKKVKQKENKPKTNGKKPLLIIIVLCLVVGLTGGGYFYQQSRDYTNNSTFGKLQTAQPADFSVLKPENWKVMEIDEKDTYGYAAPGFDDGINMVIVAGYDVLGNDFKDLPKEKQDDLIGQLKKGSKPENFLQIGPNSDCKNPEFQPYEQVEYDNAFYAAKTTGTCKNSDEVKYIVGMMLVLDNGETIGVSFKVNERIYEESKDEIDKILMSIKSTK